MNEKNIKVFDVKTGCQKMLLYYCFYCNQRKGITCVLVMECEACEKTFTRKANLKRHEEKCQGVFKCEECDLKPCKITAISFMVRSGEICLSINHPGYQSISISTGFSIN